MPKPPVMGEEGAGAELRARRAERRRQEGCEGGDQERGTFPMALVGACSKAKRHKMNFSNPEKLQESCRLGRAAKGMFCSCAVHVLLQPDKLQLHSLTHSIHS